MAVIAGYVGHRGRRALTLPDRYKEVATAHGGLIASETSHPLPPRLVTDDQGRALAVLGFMLAEPKDVLATGPAALEGCEGEFVAAFMDQDGLHLVNDRFASRPCYVMRADDGTWYFSTSLSLLFTLARASYRPDVTGWLEVFTVGHTIGARTTAEGVHRLPPATHARVTPEGITERRYWRLEHRPDRSLDPARHSAEVFEAFRAGVARRTRMLGRGVVAVSGGLDSRLLAGALPVDADFSAFTFVEAAGVSDTTQTRAAAAVCQALRLSHSIERLPERVAEPSEVLALTGGMRPYHHMAVVMPYISEVRRQGRAALLGGGPGDSLAGAFIPSPAYVDPMRTVACLRDACRRRLARTQLWPLVFREEVIEPGRRAVEGELVNSFETLGGPTAAHRITAWAMVYRQSAFTFTSALHTHPDVTEAFCHLDYRYVDLMLRVPAPWLYKKAFYAYVIHRELPQLRHVPYANTGARLTGRVPTMELPHEALRDRGMALGRRAVRKLARMLPGRPARWLVMGDPKLQTEIQDRIRVAALRDVLDVRRCDDFFGKIRSGVYRTGAHEELLGCVASLVFAQPPHRR